MPANTQETEVSVNSVEETRNMCESCGDYVDAIDEYTRDNRRGIYCEPCYDDSQRNCDECGDTFDEDDMSGDYCDTCAEARSENEYEYARLNHRDYNPNKLEKFMDEEAGTIITSKRIFSAELECYYHSGRDAQIAVNDEVPLEYGCTGDGSLEDNGLEFQTPMLQGKKGEDSLRHVCEVLNKRGFTTNRTTGLHIHLDGAGLMPKTRTKHEPKALAQAFMFYIAFEDVLLSFLPASRRSNRFCLGLRNDYHAKEIAQARNLEALEKLWYRVKKRDELKDAKSGKYHHTRYFGLNLHSLLKDGHVEIRFHSGTLNATKILEWTNLHQTILDMSAGKRVKIENYEYEHWMRRKEVGLIDEIPARIKKHVYRTSTGVIGTLAMQAQNLNGLTERTQRMFEILELPERARAYFLARQKSFISTQSDNDEEVCAA